VRNRRSGSRLPRLVVTVAAALVGPAACRPPSGNHLPSPASVFDAGEVTVIAALLEAADARRPDTVAIDRALRSSNGRIRAYAMRTVGQVRIRQRAAELRVGLRDGDSSVAADAAFALGLLRDSTAAVALGAALMRPATVADAAAWALGEIGDGGRAMLGTVLRTGQPVHALAPALQAAAKLRPVPAPEVVPYLADSDPAVRRSAAYALTRSRVPTAVRPLIAVVARLSELNRYGPVTAVRQQLDAEFRSHVARGLARTVAGDSLGEPSRVALEQLVDDPHPHVRINAIRSLATYGRVARDALTRRLRDPDANVRVATAQSLNGVFASSPDEWLVAWAADTGFTYRRTLLSTAMRSGVRLPALAASDEGAWNRHRDWAYRAAAAEAAALGGPQVADEVAGPLLTDSDGRVRAAAFRAVIPFADSASAEGKPYARAALIRALRDPDAIVRATILGAFRAGARVHDAATALAAWRRAAADRDNDARIAALRILEAAWMSDSVAFSAGLRDSLAALSPPGDPLERVVVSRTTPLRHWAQSTTRTSRPASWYVEQVRALVIPELDGRPVRVSLDTDRGRVEATLYAADAPLTVANFVMLARRGYYDGLSFHRVVPNFVAQDGDPRGDGSGGPGYAIRDELNRRWYDRGAIGMALSGPDTGGSQYFITHSPQPHLDGHYTVFGHVTDGFAALDALVQGDRIRSMTIR
jgi:cyclophilin family peptidyl-prolyl cis-trans isomerase/HEAT repeat protein